MITFVTENILETTAKAIVNPVNCEGYMGKGLAYQIKLHYPETFKDYALTCKSGKLQIGSLHSFTENNKLIINFPTKDKWRASSRLSYITSGLSELISLIENKGIESVAIPPLGCGLGGLKWQDVKPLLLEFLEPIASTVDIYIYTPHN